MSTYYYCHACTARFQVLIPPDVPAGPPSPGPTCVTCRGGFVEEMTMNPARMAFRTGTPLGTPHGSGRRGQLGQAGPPPLEIFLDESDSDDDGGDDRPWPIVLLDDDDVHMDAAVPAAVSPTATSTSSATLASPPSSPPSSGPSSGPRGTGSSSGVRMVRFAHHPVPSVPSFHHEQETGLAPTRASISPHSRIILDGHLMRLRALTGPNPPGSNGERLDDFRARILALHVANVGAPPLSAAKLRSLVRVAVTAEDVAGGSACCVCLEDLKVKTEVTKLDCSHLFHHPCILPWLQLHGTCPLCRNDMTQVNNRGPPGQQEITEVTAPTPWMEMETAGSAPPSTSAYRMRSLRQVPGRSGAIRVSVSTAVIGGRRPGRRYRKEEGQAILDFITQRNLFDLIGNNAIWQDMESANIGDSRSFQSLKNHFRKTVIPKLHEYNVSEEVKVRLRRLTAPSRVLRHQRQQPL